MKKTIFIFILLLILFFVGIFIAINIYPNDKVNDTTSLVTNTSHNIVTNIMSNTNQQHNTVSNELAENELDEKDDETEIFADYYEKADKLLENMTLEEKVGQMFLVRYPESDAVEEIKKYSPGGYILFGRDFENETKESILEEITNWQDNSKIKMIIGVDEEGGTVVRVSQYKAFRSSPFKSPQALWQEGQLPKILEDSKEKSALLKSIGINMNLTPVADVPTDTSSFIYKRSYGRGAEKTAIYVAELIETMNEDNILSAMKHFPGYGDNVDTHTGIAIDKRTYSDFQNTDFLPFKSGIEAGGPTILVSHNIINCMYPEYPASLS